MYGSLLRAATLYLLLYRDIHCDKICKQQRRNLIGNDVELGHIGNKLLVLKCERLFSSIEGTHSKRFYSDSVVFCLAIIDLP